MWFLILFTTIAAIAFGYYKLKQAQEKFIEAKTLHETIATVTTKEDFRAEKENQFYVNEYGDTIKMQLGEQQKRVYYSIDKFDGLGEPRQSRVIEAEKKRMEEFGPRFIHAVPWYDEVKVGDKLEITYRAFRDGKTEIWGIVRQQKAIAH